MLFEKVDYSKDKEAPITIGNKILKKIDKEWGRDSDIYGEIEEVLIHFGSDSPKRLAMALKRILNNYDMWEAPYKGLVSKIEKWQFVNENIAAAAGRVVGKAALRMGAGIAARKLAKKLRRNESVKESLDNTDPRFVKLVWNVKSLSKKYKADLVILYDEFEGDYFWDYADIEHTADVIAYVNYNNGNVTVEKI